MSYHLAMLNYLAMSSIIIWQCMDYLSCRGDYDLVLIRDASAQYNRQDSVQVTHAHPTHMSPPQPTIVGHTSASSANS